MTYGKAWERFSKNSCSTKRFITLHRRLCTNGCYVSWKYEWIPEYKECVLENVAQNPENKTKCIHHHLGYHSQKVQLLKPESYSIVLLIIRNQIRSNIKERSLNWRIYKLMINNTEKKADSKFMAVTNSIYLPGNYQRAEGDRPGSFLSIFMCDLWCYKGNVIL